MGSDVFENDFVFRIGPVVEPGVFHQNVDAPVYRGMLRFEFVCSLYQPSHLLSCGLPFGSSSALVAKVIHHNGCAQADNQDDKGFLDVGFHKDNQLKKRGDSQYRTENASLILGKHLVILFQNPLRFYNDRNFDSDSLFESVFEFQMQC